MSADWGGLYTWSGSPKLCCPWILGIFTLSQKHRISQTGRHLSRPASRPRVNAEWRPGCSEPSSQAWEISKESEPQPLWKTCLHSDFFVLLISSQNLLSASLRPPYPVLLPAGWHTAVGTGHCFRDPRHCGDTRAVLLPPNRYFNPDPLPSGSF